MCVCVKCLNNNCYKIINKLYSNLRAYQNIILIYDSFSLKT